MNKIEDLKSAVDNLKRLLDEPKMGLASWWMMVDLQLAVINEIWDTSNDVTGREASVR